MRHPYTPGTMPTPNPKYDRRPPSVAGLILSPQERAQALTAALFDGPDLTGAACKGMAPLFDERGGRETEDAYTTRLRAAQAVCARCPVLDRCASVAEGMDARTRGGVWAGADHEHAETRRQRMSAERKAAAEPTDETAPAPPGAPEHQTEHPTESPTTALERTAP